MTDSTGDGNVLSRTCGGQTVRFHWTAESQLAALKVVGGDSVEFAYDAAGRLARKTVNGTVQRRYLWQGANLLAELTGPATGKVAEYSYYPGLDRPHAVITGTTPAFAHTDGLGNVIALTDSATPSVQRTYFYDTWGQVTGGSDDGGFNGADRTRFKGALWLGPEVELYYMRARWYEPKSGRFLSEDPIGLAGGINPYGFVDGDPINGRDPTGLGCQLWVIVRYDTETGKIIEVLGYFRIRDSEATGGSSGSTDNGILRAPVQPDECPIAPRAPDDGSLAANMRIAASLSILNPAAKLAAFYSLTRGRGPWDYKRTDPDPRKFEAFGNFHYGATGSAAGVSEQVLLRAAGYANQRGAEENSVLGAFFKALGSRPYGDEGLFDAGNIQAGIQYNRNNCDAQ